MAVLECQRKVSDAQFIVVAKDIEVNTLSLITRLSARYSRTLGDNLAKMSMDILNYTISANRIFPHTLEDFHLKRIFLQRAKAMLWALCAQLKICRDILMENPQGAYFKANGKQLDKSEAIKRLDNKFQTLGDLVNKENSLLKGVIDKNTRDEKMFRGKYNSNYETNIAEKVCNDTTNSPFDSMPENILPW